MTKIEPGWYRDPAAPETQRYWDGEEWVGKPVGINETPPDQPEPLPPPEPEPVTPPVDPVQVDSPPRHPTGGGFLPRLEPKSIERVMAGRTLAHPGQRFVARLVDILIVAVMATIVNSWFIYQYFQALMPAVREVMNNPSMSASEVTVPDRAYELQFLMLFITILVWFAYEVPSTVKSGRTLGKRLMGVGVVPLGSYPLRWSHAIARWSLMMLSLACFPFGLVLAVIDCLWCLRDKPFRQCIHDKNAGTMVINIHKGDEDASNSR